MTNGPARPCTSIFVVVFLLFQFASAQVSTRPSIPGRPGVPGSGVSRPTIPGTQNRLIVFSGRVVTEDGQALPEPVAIERVCNGTTRREGYTDLKGEFQIQLGSTPDFQDASESGLPSVIGSGTAQSNNRRQLNLQTCEFRAVLAGFQSSSASIPMEQENFQYDLGTIVLKKMGNVKGGTISITTMSAPNEARRAYEGAQKALQQRKFKQAEDKLKEAVDIYPRFAAAWFMLGNLQERRHQFDEARTDYQRALSADPQYVSPWFGLALIAVEERNWSEAAQLTARVVDLNAYAYPTAYFYNAAANYNLGRFGPAEENARKYMELDTGHEHPDAALLLSNLLQHRRDYAAAAQQIREYLALVPRAPNAEELKVRAKRLDDLSMAQKQ